jgi:hypothetical protein
MVIPHSFSNRPPATPRTRRVFGTALSVVGLSAVVAAPVAAVSFWLLLTDPTTVGAVLERGDLLPLARALARALGQAISAVLAYL